MYFFDRLLNEFSKSLSNILKFTLLNFVIFILGVHKIILTFRANSPSSEGLILFPNAIFSRNNSKLIYSGSSAIFGNSMEDQHLSPYSWTKSKNIELVHNYKKWFNLNFAICYFYNVYGPGQICEGSYATVIGIFENLYKNKKPLTVVKPGTQKRCFTHIDDIVEGLILIGQKGNGDDYHLGIDENKSILDIAEMFETEYVFMNEREGDRQSSKVQSDKCLRELNWTAKIKIEDYINNIKKVA